MVSDRHKQRLTKAERAEYARQVFELLKGLHVVDVGPVCEAAREQCRQHSVERYRKENPVLTKGRA